jgi:hypothetical protein
MWGSFSNVDQKALPLLSQGGLTLRSHIDMLLASHYGFTEEELDFIINYDIKYRMGLSGGADAGEAPSECTQLSVPSWPIFHMVPKRSRGQNPEDGLPARLGRRASCLSWRLSLPYPGWKPGFQNSQDGCSPFHRYPRMRIQWFGHSEPLPPPHN